ncbi:MAG: DUF559 domain-containing protein [bacterium]
MRVKWAGNIITLAKNLRKRATSAEMLLWRQLRSKQLEGFKFRRQEPIARCSSFFDLRPQTFRG